MSDLSDTIAAIEAELEWFEWRSPFHGSVIGGEVRVEDDRLCMTVWSANNDTPDDERMYPLQASVSVQPGVDPREQIRSLIHTWLCHEADEQLWFGETAERPFYPEHPTVPA